MYVVIENNKIVWQGCFVDCISRIQNNYDLSDWKNFKIARLSDIKIIDYKTMQWINT